MRPTDLRHQDHNERWEDKWPPSGGSTENDGKFYHHVEDRSASPLFVHQYDQESIHTCDSRASSIRSAPHFEQFDPTFGTIPAMPSPNSSPRSHSGQHMLGAPMQFLNHPSSLPYIGKDSDSSRSASPVRKATMESFITNIDLFVHALEEVTSLRVTSQQKRRALVRSRNNVSRNDAAIATLIRHQRAKGSVMDGNEFLSLYEISLQARDELGPLEDEFETTEYQLVPKEDDLSERGEELERQWATLKLDFERFEMPHSTKSSQHRQGQDRFLQPQHDPCTEKDAEPFPARGRPAHRLSCDGLPQLTRAQDDISKASMVQGTAQSEPLVRLYAPDLFFGNSWTPTSHLENSPTPKLVEDEDLSDVETLSTDIPNEGNAVLLGNGGPYHCPFLDELATLEYSPFGRRVSFWLLCRLQSSRLEVLRLRETIDIKAKGWKWSDILLFWATDEAAISKTPPLSFNLCHTNLAETSWRQPVSIRQSMSEPRPFGRPTFGLQFTAITRANKHPKFGRHPESLR